MLFAGRVNGADIVTRLLYTLAGSRTVYLLLHVMLALLFLLWIRRANRWSTLRLEIAGPVILEAAIYAMTLGALITLVVDRMLGLGITGNEMVAALGAGVHEELLFRLGLFAGLVTVFTGAGNDRRVSVPLALVVSSVLFAAAHHAGAQGEPFTAHAMVFRTLAGCAFGAIFWFRSFAHAVYAHVLYDLVVAASS
ncbi:MAG: CPBP family intramembrane metalloprotease [Kofleriaceae bacterium]|nr:CPBP family intramembrane metalloprotease [Kofleriaceae bacterium]